ncbi:protein ASYMMETRIC LEAVES 2-like [Humulus lupulus]|uniref:protein ASYMMETRIC LEAVES 2-like n=1 Tax=Humulus lupulus TaxID=3486 RepID=UPI002B415424|nr:protein ASYMMETRIC LEAVES 2-like [Humulus lupulus]
MASSSSNSPCGACKLLRRKCQPECVFAPYFPADQPQKFANVHKVFGASNTTKLLNELQPSQREDAVNSLAYEADIRLRDPVYGCVGVITLLQHQLRQLQMELSCTISELSMYQKYLGITQHGLTVSPHQNLISGAAAAQQMITYVYDASSLQGMDVSATAGIGQQSRDGQGLPPHH